MKMTKKNACTLAIAIGAVTFVSAAAVGIASSNGYGVYKNAVKKLVTAKNYTMELTGSVTVDGKSTDDEFYLSQKIDKDNNSSSRKEGTSKDNISWEEYYQDGIIIHGSGWDDNEDSENDEPKKMHYTAFDTSPSSSPRTIINSFIGDNDDKTAEKFIRFAEIAGDLIVGDLKNNFIYEGEENGISTYSISLDSFQIPEIISSGVDFLISASAVNEDLELRKQNAADYPIEYLYQNVIIDKVNCTVKVGEDGNISDNTLSIRVTGDDWDGSAHEAVFTMNISCSDFGTTVPDKIDINGANVEKESERNKKRKAELNKLLSSKDLSKDEREAYEEELEWLEDDSDR